MVADDAMAWLTLVRKIRTTKIVEARFFCSLAAVEPAVAADAVAAEKLE